MANRREFMERAAGAAAVVITAGSFKRILGANDRVRFGLIGAGGRGQEIFKVAVATENTQPVAVADVYTRRLDEIRQLVPGIQTHSDFRRLLDDKSIDAVLIATPQHQHALNFVPAIQAGKDIYQEKTMAFNPDHARRMRKAFEGSNRVVQVGIQSTSTPAVAQARELATTERMGPITAIHSHMYRNAAYGGWLRPIPADCDLQHVNWRMFEGDGAAHDFDPERYMNWRFFWDYSGGNVFENMVHQVGFWYKVLNLNIPRSVSMSGGNYLSPKMQVPDTMDVMMDQPENLLFTWNSGFYNHHFDIDEFVLGSKGTIARNDQDVRYLPEGRQTQAQPAATKGATLDIVGSTDDTVPHMKNFFQCVRSREQPNCPFEIGYRSAIACQMAVTSYRSKRAVRWDHEREDII